ncbi:MAG: hypothetical protein AB7Q97_05865 [Gammaproteobacteria bacterium]
MKRLAAAFLLGTSATTHAAGFHDLSGCHWFNQVVRELSTHDDAYRRDLLAQLHRMHGRSELNAREFAIALTAVNYYERLEPAERGDAPARAEGMCPVPGTLISSRSAPADAGGGS